MNQQFPIKRYLFLLFVLVLLLFGFFWFSTHGYINVNVQGSGSGEFTYYLTDQGNGKTSSEKTTEKTYKKLVKRGSYKVTAWQNNTSYFEIKDVGGFLSSTDFSGKLHPQVSREFVGNNPGQCLSQLGARVVSYVCGSLFSSVNIHVPATATTPTYILKNPNGSSVFGYVKSLLHLDNADYVITKQPQGGDALGGYFINNVSSDLLASNPKSLPDLDANTNYNFVAFDKGFLAYSDTLDNIYVFSSPTSTGKKVSVEAPQTKGLEPLTLTANSGSFAILYGKKTSPKVKNNKSEVVVWNNEKSRHYTFNKGYSSLEFCASQKLCLIDNTGMGVYSISNTASLEYSIWGVVGILCDNGACLASQRDGILSLNPDTASGYTAYSFGNYRYNNLQVSNGAFLLTATGPDNKLVILRLNVVKDDSQQIDQKVGELLKKTDIISTVSAYGRYIYISPNFGRLLRNPVTGRFDYDPVVKSRVNGEINKFVQSLNIDPAMYTVINIGNL